MACNWLRRAWRAILGGALAVAGPAAAEALVVGINSGDVEFIDAPLAGVNAGAPLYGNGQNILSGDVLLGPGNGFRDTNLAGGVVINNIAGAAIVPGLQFPAPLPQIMPDGAAQTSMFALGAPFPGGGGIFWVPPTFAFDTVHNANATVNVSNGEAIFAAPANQPPLQSGAVIGISGFMPVGAYGSIGLRGSVTNPLTGAVIPIPDVTIALDGAGPGTDFARANGVTVNANGLLPLVGIVETPVFDVVTGVLLGQSFSAYGVSLGPLVAFPGGGGASTADFTLTIITDPGAEIYVDPLAVPPGTQMPDFGFQGVPEPSTFLLAALGTMTLLLVRRRR